MPKKRKRVPSDDLVFKILLLSALNVDYKTIAKKVKYNVEMVSSIIHSKPALPIEHILRKFDGNFEAIAEETNCSVKQIRKIILTTQPIVDLKVLNVQGTLNTNNEFGHQSSTQSTDANPMRKSCEKDDSDKVDNGKNIIKKLNANPRWILRSTWIRSQMILSLAMMTKIL